VNQDGDRLHGFEVNTLTVIAPESYEAFAENLQKEIEKDTGIRFGIVEEHQFATIPIWKQGEEPAPLGFERSKELWAYLKAQGYIDAKGKVQDALKKALKDGTLAVPEAFEAQRGQVAEILRKLSGRLEIKNADDRRVVRTRQAVLQSPEFKALWDRIKSKTTYRVMFDNEALVESCMRAVRNAPPIAKTRLQWRKAGIAIGKAGVEATEIEGAATVVLNEIDIELPDLLTDLQDRTQLTRRSIQRILAGSLRLEDFKRNPQQFIEIAADAINRCKRLALVDGIKYQRLGDEYYYAQELFENEELTGYLKNILTDTKKSVYEQVVYDMGTEKAFAEQLEFNTDVKVYVKLPGWFTVPTPLGSYNPDWASLLTRSDPVAFD
jgi:type III restriction enzyme